MPVLIWSACIIELIRLSPLNLSFLLVLQFVNGLVWYIEDSNSTDALDSIKKELAPNALVKRDGVWKTVKVPELVVGDRIQISSGDFLPADCVIGFGECLIDQSMLTGETISVLKNEGSNVYMGSICKRGEIEANVTATGINTFFGKANLLTSQVNQKGKVEKILGKIAFLLMIISSIVVSVIFIVFLVKGNEFLESLSMSVLLMILSLPIAMQAVCAATLAVGAKDLGKKKAIICRLASIEELAGMDILCLHKSAILTKDEPTVHNPVLIQCKTIQKLFLLAFLASRRDAKNSLDRCICEYAIENCKIQYEVFEEIDFSQYDPKLKYSESLFRHTITGKETRCCKGAPQVILAMTQEWKLENAINSHILQLAIQGYTSIAVASTNSKNELKFRGLIPVFDPFCEGAIGYIEDFSKLNIKLTLLTGDHISIAKEFSRSLKIGDIIFSAEIFNKDTTAVQREFVDTILLQANGFAEVYPEHKFTIVKMLQNKKKKVGITGVSINDAAALKKADIGIAGYGASDASKSAADIIFEEPGLNIVIQAITRARKIFERSKTYSLYRISCSFQLLFFFFISLVCLNPKTDFSCHGSFCKDIPNTFALPVIVLVLIALLNDATIISISYDKVKTPKRPCRWYLGRTFIISSTLGSISFFSSFIYLLLTLSNMNSNHPNKIFKIFEISTFTYGEVLTAIFLKISISNYLTLFSARTNGWFFMCLPGKALGFTGFGAMIITTLLSKYWYLNIQPKNSVIIASLASISWTLIIITWIFCIIVLFIQDFFKIIINRCFESNIIISQDKILENLCLNETTKILGKENHTEIQF